MARGEYDNERVGAQPSTFQAIERGPRDVDVEVGFGGLAIGLLLGVVVGSRFTFHTPVRRRTY